MKTYDRQQAILRLLEARGSVDVAELAEEFDVSEGTIRNDLTALEEQNQLTRVRGGAIPINGSPARPIFNSRVKINADSKKKIARWASELVSDGDVILLDASSTTYHMAAHLEDRHNITVVTNHIETARLLNTDPTKRVILLGGYLRPDNLAVTGEIGQEILKGLHLNTAFISCVGFSLEAGLMEADIQEASLKRQILQSAAHVVALVDSSKFDKVGLTAFASVDQLSHLVTDDRITADMVKRLRHADVALTICGAASVQSLTPQTGARKHYRIGFANLSESLAFSVDVRRGLERAAKATDKLDIVYVDNNLDGQTAIQVADELIDQGIDLVIEYQIDELAGNVIMNKFNQQGIPVIAVDIPMVGATYFGVDNFTAGDMAGQGLGRWIADHWNGEVDYVVVLEEKRAGPLPGARIQGQMHGLTSIIGEIPSDRFIHLDSGNSSETSYNNTCPILKDMPQGVKIGFICFNDDAAIGALYAARELGMEDCIAIVGQGADRQIRKEIRNSVSAVIGSTAFMPEQYGEGLIELALKLLDGVPLPPAVYMAHEFINQDNVDQYYPEQ